MAFTSAKYLDAAKTQISAIRDDGETVICSAMTGLLVYDEIIESGLPIAPAVAQPVTPDQAP